MLKRLGRTQFVQTAIGSFLAFALKFVWWTSRHTSEPADPYERIGAHIPFIITFWHGQHFMVPFARRPDHDIRVLISRHGDGEINAVAARQLGMGVLRGSGSHKGKAKGGAAGFLNMLKLLESGVSVSMTADVPKRGRIAGDGIVLLAKHSGRPVVPVCFSSNPRIDLDTWDKASINLPFGRTVFVAGDPIYVDGDADEAEIEAKRREIEVALNRVTDRARAIADGKDAPAHA
ncbi:MAG: lysophospholipid acyltransferase family protein [Hyphomicrobiales bacterium]